MKKLECVLLNEHNLISNVKNLMSKKVRDEYHIYPSLN